MLGRVCSAPTFLRASFSIVVVLLMICILTSLLVGPWCGQSILTTGRYWKRWPRWAQRRRKMCYQTWISTLPISVPTGTSFRKVRRWKETSYREIDGKKKNHHFYNIGSLLSFFNCLYTYMHMQYFDNLRGHTRGTTTHGTATISRVTISRLFCNATDVALDKINFQPWIFTSSTRDAH